ncbi:helix-turn-helix domain-containing protein [Streptomyces sp. NRRL S-350]|uniref:helix-turn-helix domain-containing protein n=1 Tax=Streptomyces sp. NRRL S-350 TaxID=1463902 RepID=UPI0004C00BFA|nr:helix-turn-helix domain-containing protein [Streptomyces sp. NRRL S-350]
MLTLAALARQPEYFLHPLDTAVSGDRVVDRAELLTPCDRPARPSGTLLVCSSDTIDIGQARAWLRHLAEQGAAGLVLASDAPAPAQGPLLEAARHAALPLFASGAPVATWRHTLISRITELRRQATDRHAVRLAHLLDHLGNDSAPAGDLLDWLARELDAEVSLQLPTAVLPAAGGTFTSTHPLRDNDRLLTARRHHPFSASDRDLLARSATVLTIRRRTSVPAGDTVLAETLHAVRLAAFQALMTGHIEPAQRILGPLSPYLLDTDDVQIAIIDCAGTSRDETFARAETLLCDTGFAVRCPAFDGHIIIVVPHHDPNLPEAPAVTALRPLAADRSHRLSLGISPTLPLEDTATGYALAHDAIATARISPTRAAVAPRTPGLLDALDPPTAQQWATTLLQPVLNQRSAKQQLSTVTLGLEFDVSAASRILGIHRNTLSRRIHTTLRATGLATDRTADRITLSLALQIHALHGPATDPFPHPAPTLAHLLAQPPVTHWATAALAPLNQECTDQRTTRGDTLARTLRTWTHQDFRVDTTAQRLNLYPATVRGHLHTSEALLGWMLLSNLPTGPLPDDEDAPGKQSGLRNLAAALQAAPGTPRTALPDPTGEFRRGPV